MAPGLHQEAVHRHPPVDRRGRRDAGLALPHGGHGDPDGATLVVRESQMALFVNEGQVADVFGPGTYKLTTQTLPVLTYLKNWDKLFQSPFKSDVYFSARASRLTRNGARPSPSPSATPTLAPCACAPSATTPTVSPTPSCCTARSLARASPTRRRPGRPAARSGAAEHQQRHRQQRRSVSRPGGESADVCRRAGQELAPAFEKLASSSKP